LLPTDFSDHAAHALAVASVFAKDFRAKLLLLHVDPPPLFHGEVVDRRQPDYRRALRAQLDAVPLPEVPVERLLAGGDVAAEILRIAQDRNCDLIVMGTHGRGGVARIVLGSVAEAVVRAAPCPVVTVPRPAQVESFTHSELGGVP
jgi:nucleotide-binding universal stress UspA family protein